LDEHLEEEETVDEEEGELIEQSSRGSPESTSELHGYEYCELKGKERCTLHPHRLRWKES
jgi:hypothetical protein